MEAVEPGTITKITMQNCSSLWVPSATAGTASITRHGAVELPQETLSLMPLESCNSCMAASPPPNHYCRQSLHFSHHPCTLSSLPLLPPKHNISRPHFFPSPASNSVLCCAEPSLSDQYYDGGWRSQCLLF